MVFWKLELFRKGFDDDIMSLTFTLDMIMMALMMTIMMMLVVLMMLKILCLQKLVFMPSVSTNAGEEVNTALSTIYCILHILLRYFQVVQ